MNNLDPDLVVQRGKTVQRFNTSPRMSHIKDFTENTKDLREASYAFALATALPFLRLLDEMLTIEEAVLQNAAIIQRLQITSEPQKTPTVLIFERPREMTVGSRLQK